MTDSEIEEVAEEFGKLVSELPEYKALLEAEEKIHEDEETQKKFTEVRKLRNQMEVAYEEGEREKYDEFAEEYEEAERDLNQMEPMKRYNEAAEELSERLRELDLVISEELDIRFAVFASE